MIKSDQNLDSLLQFLHVFCFILCMLRVPILLREQSLFSRWGAWKILGGSKKLCSWMGGGVKIIVIDFGGGVIFFFPQNMDQKKISRFFCETVIRFIWQGWMRWEGKSLNFYIMLSLIIIWIQTISLGFSLHVLID